MYTKENLLADLQAYNSPYDATEQGHLQAIIAFLQTTDNPFVRTNLAGHITGSAWVLSPDGRQVLLTHHAILDKWLQLGGHADGEANIQKVAMREAQEESGIQEISSLSQHLFDVDVHQIPENKKKGEPAHYHYDIRYLFQAAHTRVAVNHESNALAWVSLEEIYTITKAPSILRMAYKWKRMVDMARV